MKTSTKVSQTAANQNLRFRVFHKNGEGKRYKVLKMEKGGGAWLKVVL